MKTLLITAEFPPYGGGVGTYACNLARGLQSVGASPHVLTSWNTGEPESILDIPVTRTSPAFNRKGVKLAPLLTRAFLFSRRERPRILIAMTWAHEGITAFILHRLLGIPYGVVVHGGEILKHRRRYPHRLLMRTVLRNARSLIANSSFTKDLLLSLGIPSERIAVINPPIVGSEWTKQEQAPDIDQKFNLQGKRVLLTAARLVKRKGHRKMIQALPRLLPRFPDLLYVITGIGPYRSEIESCARQAGVGEQVRLTGYVSPEELRALYHRAEIYVSPSEEDSGVEGFGISLAEAGACGIPVVAGREGGVPDAVIHGKTGFLLPSPDGRDLVDFLQRLLEDATLRRRLGENGRLYVAENLDLQRQGQRLKEHLVRNERNPKVNSGTAGASLGGNACPHQRRLL